MIVIVPARFDSSRLPGKPLILLNGIPMIIRTCLQCLKVVPKQNLWVATNDVKIAGICALYGIQYIMTPQCPTGTDRVAFALNSLNADRCINVQGDEPLLNPNDLLTLIAQSDLYPDRVLNGFCPLSEQTFTSPSMPKVVVRPDGRLLYASRAPIPTTKTLSFSGAHRQVCLYAFPKTSLEIFAKSGKTPLESIEDIEILRFLELGMDVHMIPMSSDSIPVDTFDDILIAETALRRRGL